MPQVLLSPNIDEELGVFFVDYVVLEDGESFRRYATFDTEQDAQTFFNQLLDDGASILEPDSNQIAYI